MNKYKCINIKTSYMITYTDAEASEETAVGVVVDAKINYPSACNAAETLLLHREVKLANIDI